MSSATSLGYITTELVHHPHPEARLLVLVLEAPDWGWQANLLNVPHSLEEHPCDLSAQNHLQLLLVLVH